VKAGKRVQKKAQKRVQTQVQKPSAQPTDQRTNAGAKIRTDRRTDRRAGKVAAATAAASRGADTDAKTINLALQGGGSHGAYTWGVLDALLEDGRLDFEGVTGASAGAMNAVVMADGWLDGLAAGRDPREAAREALRAFWELIGRQPSVFSLNGAWGAMVPNPAQNLASNPMFLWMDLVSRLFSPYQLNPFNYNPLRSVLAESIDFERLQRQAPCKLFVCATNVRTGRPRVFREGELTLDMVLASACLPFAFQAVRVKTAQEDDFFWDGGYMGNPALWPLFYSTASRDLLLVQINPLKRDEVPESAQEIAERINEISFNASLLHELRAIDFVQRLLAENRLDAKRYKKIWLHVASAEEQMKRFGASSKYNTSGAFLHQLFELGRDTGRDWLDQKWAYVGHAPSVQIADTFL
jgi:NTE family protein